MFVSARPDGKSAAEKTDRKSGAVTSVAPAQGEAEREAEQVADHIRDLGATHTFAGADAPPDGTIGEPLIQRMARPSAPGEEYAWPVDDATAATVSSPGPGEPLQGDVRGPIEIGLGADLSDVRLHRGAPAVEATDAISARAFTHGSDIFLGTGERPDDVGLLAHEATHVVQQRSAPSQNVLQRISDRMDAPPPPRRSPSRYERYIAQHEDFVGLNLNEESLASALSIEVGNGRYEFVRSVINALPDTDQDDVGVELVSRLGDDRLAEMARDEHGLVLINTLIAAILSWPIYDDEQLQSRRLHEARAHDDLFHALAPVTREFAIAPTPEQQAEERREQVRQLTSLDILNDQMILQRTRLRREAFQTGHISPALYALTALLDVEMTAQRVALSSGEVDPRTRERLAGIGRAIQAELARVTPSRSAAGAGGSVEWNEYTGENRITVSGGLSEDVYTAGYGIDFAAAIVDGNYALAMSHYRRLTDGIDDWILRRIEQRTSSTDPLYQQLQTSRHVQEGLGRIARHRPTRVPAIFYSSQALTDAGAAPEMPIFLFYWKEGNTWHLKDVTFHDRPFHATREAAVGEAHPPHALFEALNTRDHLPPGVLTYQFDGEPRRDIVTRGEFSASDIIGFVATALAVVGLALIGAEPAAAALGIAGFSGAAATGGVILGVSGAVGVVGGTLHIIEQEHAGTATSQSLAVDVLQIIGGLAAVGSIAAGFRVAATASTTQQALSLSGRAAQLTALADAVYIPLGVIGAAADVTSFVITTHEGVGQMRRMLAGYEAAGERQKEQMRRSLALFVAQTIATGLMTFLSVRGTRQQIADGRSLVLTTDADGVARVLPRELVGTHGGPEGRTMAATPDGAGAPAGGTPRSDLPPRSDPNSPHHLLDLMRLGHDPDLVAPGPAPRGETRIPDNSTVTHSDGRRSTMSPFEAYSLYNRALARSDGREVGICYNRQTGEYSVRMGTEVAVNAPGLLEEGWIFLVHFHPNETGARIFQGPASADFLGTVRRGLSGIPASEFVEFALPGGGRGRAEYGYDPGVEPPFFVRMFTEDGPERIVRFADPEAYNRARWESELGEIYVDPDSDLARQILDNIRGETRGRRAQTRTMASDEGDEITDIVDMRAILDAERLRVATAPTDADDLLPHSPVLVELVEHFGGVRQAGDHRLYNLMRSGNWDTVIQAGRVLDQAHTGTYDRFVRYVDRIGRGEELSSTELQDFHHIVDGLEDVLLQTAVYPVGIGEFDPQRIQRLAIAVYDETPEIAALHRLSHGTPTFEDAERILRAFTARRGVRSRWVPDRTRRRGGPAGFNNGELWLEQRMQTNPRLFVEELLHEITSYEMWARTGGVSPDAVVPGYGGLAQTFDHLYRDHPPGDEFRRILDSLGRALVQPSEGGD